MNRRIVLLLTAALALAAGAALLALDAQARVAQGGAAIDWWVVAGGGGPATGVGVALNDTLGQPIAGPSSGGGDVALGAGYWYGWPIPAVVELAWFTATPRVGAIALAWETASEIDLLGFHVYRAEAVDGPRTRLTGDLLPGQGPGSRYEFVDGAVTPGATYWYWLEAVDAHGAKTLRGPASAAAGETACTLYLPLIRR